MGHDMVEVQLAHHKPMGCFGFKPLPKPLNFLVKYLIHQLIPGPSVRQAVLGPDHKC